MAENNNNNGQEVDALCPECGQAFKAFVDKIADDQPENELDRKVTCPVCGCGECPIGKP